MVQPFEVKWSEASVQAVLDQVRAYPWPPIPEVPNGWAYGCDAGYLKDLCRHWTEAYDWRSAVADLNRFPQFTARVEDYDLHFLHVIGEAGGNILNLVMSHRQQDFFDVDIDMEVEDAKHATAIMAALRTNPSVDTVERARG